MKLLTKVVVQTQNVLILKTNLIALITKFVQEARMMANVKIEALEVAVEAMALLIRKESVSPV